MQLDEATLTSLALYLSSKALPIYFIALAGVLLATGGLIWRLQHHVQNPQRINSRLPHWRIYGVLIAVCATVFGLIAEEIGPGELMPGLDQTVSYAVGQAISPLTRDVFKFVTHFGDPLTLTILSIAVALVLLLRGERALALGWGVTISLATAVNPLLKLLFGRTRPLHDPGPVLAHGLSFPSGHTSSAVIVYGLLAYLLISHLPLRWHLPVALLTSALIFSIGASRVFIQVHFVSDVVAGFASGTALLVLCIGSLALLRHYLAKRTLAHT
jgi:undecaprenyl-diphosphatase